MRPLVVIPAALLMVAAMTTTYFAPPGTVDSGTLMAGTPTDISTPSSMLNLLGTFPLTLSYSHLPQGATVRALVCPSRMSATACMAGSYQEVLFNRSSDTFTFQLKGNQALVVTTQAGGVTYQASSPLWAEYSTLFIVFAFGGFVAVIVGIVLKGKDEPGRVKREAASARPPARNLPPPAQPREAGSQWPPVDPSAETPEESQGTYPDQTQGEWR